MESTQPPSYFRVVLPVLAACILYALGWMFGLEHLRKARSVRDARPASQSDAGKVRVRGTLERTRPAQTPNGTSYAIAYWQVERREGKAHRVMCSGEDHGELQLVEESGQRTDLSGLLGSDVAIISDSFERTVNAPVQLDFADKRSVTTSEIPPGTCTGTSYVEIALPEHTPVEVLLCKEKGHYVRCKNERVEMIVAVNGLDTVVNRHVQHAHNLLRVLLMICAYAMLVTGLMQLGIRSRYGAARQVHWVRS